jgi:hypothetical protein
MEAATFVPAVRPKHATYGKVGITDRYYSPPTGEQVCFSCTNGQETINAGTAILKRVDSLYDDTPHVEFTPDQVGNWTCAMTYSGDGVLGPTSAEVTLEVGTNYKNRKCDG